MVEIAENYSFEVCVVGGTCQTISSYTGIWVIPCQINKEFWVTSLIVMKVGVLVVPMVLTTHIPTFDQA